MGRLRGFGISTKHPLEVLPTAERLQGCTVAGDSVGVKKNFFSEVPEEAGDREFVSTPATGTATLQLPEEGHGETGEHGWDCLCEECVPL